MKRKGIPLSNIKIDEQKRTSMCGPAALRIFLSFFKIYKTEEQLTRKCHATVARGTEPHQLVAALEELGFKTYKGINAGGEKSWKMLDHWVNKMKLPVIVDWFSPFDHPAKGSWDGHYSVVIRIDRKTITLADPEFKKKRERVVKISRTNFMRVWFDYPSWGKNDYPKKNKNIFLRWWLTGYPAPLNSKK